MDEERQPLHYLFDCLNNNKQVEILTRSVDEKYKGTLLGFDEHINLVINDGTKTFLIKGDCISGIIFE